MPEVTRAGPLFHSVSVSINHVIKLATPTRSFFFLKKSKNFVRNPETMNRTRHQGRTPDYTLSRVVRAGGKQNAISG